jgi:hypothetical protein
MSSEPGPSGPLNLAPASPSASIAEPKPSYSAIGRHLTVLRDAAATILALFAKQGEPAPAPEAGAAASSTTPGKEQEAVGRKKNPLTIRIERHTAAINRALGVTTRLNPSKLSRWELSQDVRKDLDWQDQVIRGILDAEVHFWAATLERNPQVPLDETELSWLDRITRLAAIVGCSPGNEQHLALLQKWHEDRFPEPGENVLPKNG